MGQSLWSVILSSLNAVIIQGKTVEYTKHANTKKIKNKMKEVRARRKT